ncbi:MAG: UvrD-helicase domain-containing protein [Gemmatimonadetes bacterium]|nr:UvrD-helicase domain-containing protein [Gemmatimonadota bacterium]
MSTSPSLQAPPRELVLASAGSGKTYHLSSRILGLLAMGVPPGEVLATTFTRKAAGEILERVLVRLAEGASDPAKARELGRDAHPSLTRPEECRGLLGRLLTDLHQMNVGTLDAFFIRVARNFFLELGLPPRWTIADEPTQDRIRTEAVLVALAEADKAQLVELLRMLNRDAADRQVHSALLEKVDSLLAIRRQLDPKTADPWAAEFGVTEQLSPDTLREHVQVLATRLPGLEVPLTQRGDPVKQWVSARDNASEAISRLDWDAAFAAGIGAKVLAGEDSFSRKPIPPEFGEIFRQVIELARSDLAPKLRRETRALGRLAELLESAFERTQRRVGAYRFDDVTYLLGGPDPAGNRDDLGYRLDQRVQHLLLDEPTTGLDPVTRSMMDEVMIRVREKLGVTGIAVTHDMKSAYAIADRIAMLYHGRVRQVGTVDEIQRSHDSVVRQFIEGRPEAAADAGATQASL